MKRKVGAAILAVISMVLWVFFVWSYAAYKNKTAPGDLKPVQEITGIYTEATLKPDSVIDYGVSIPMDDNGPWCHCAFIAGEITNTETGETIKIGPTASDIRNLRIVDVYGSKCTIVYGVHNPEKSSTERYVSYDFPLSDLEYNEIAVASAQDFKKTELYGSRFSLRLSENRKGSGNKLKIQ